MASDRSEAWGQVGAMYWRNHGLEDYDMNPKPMPHLAVFTPAGLFYIDCPDTDAPHEHWVRTGEPPAVSITPSINVNNDEWHGYITAGLMTP